MCCSVFNLQKLPLGSANMVAKKKKEKKRKGKDDRTLIKSNLTYLNLIFCGPERTEEKWHSQGSFGYIHPLCMCKVTSNYGSLTPKSIGSPWDRKNHHGKRTMHSGKVHSR
jgi:hypothetical protein